MRRVQFAYSKTKKNDERKETTENKKQRRKWGREYLIDAAALLNDCIHNREDKGVAALFWKSGAAQGKARVAGYLKKVQGGV